jgi:hypothetical protein
MAKLRVQASRVPTSGQARDRIVHTFYLDTDRLEVEGVDYDQLANDTNAIFATRLGQLLPFTGWETSIYNMGDTEPRPPRAKIFAAKPVAGSAPGVREVALCLSFYSERNLPRNRGRIYLGPWLPSQLLERPPETATSTCAALAADLGNLGGINVDWCIFSRTDQAYRKVTNWWVDNEWDTQRSRGLRGDARTTGTTDE